MRKVTSDSVLGDYGVKSHYMTALEEDVNALLRAWKEEVRDVRKLERHFRAWSNVARRVKVVEEALKSAEGERLREELFQSYRFLLSVLGLFDDVIKDLMKKANTEKYHKQMQDRIMKLL